MQSTTGTLVIICGSAILICMALFMTIFVVYHRRKQLEQELKNKEIEINFERKMFEVSMASAEVERSRIAQDLHDDIGASLSIIKLNFNALYEGDKGDNEILNRHIRESLDEVLTHIRRMSRELIPTSLERFGLSSALYEFTTRSSNNLIRVDYQTEGDENHRFSMKEELMFYRVTQELVTNALKHSGGTKVRVKLVMPPAPFSLTVEDDGKGFDWDNIRNRPNLGLGIDNVKGRLNVIGARIRYEVRVGRGCRAVVEWKS